MPPSDRRRYRGQRLAQEHAARLGRELRAARLGAGLSQRALAKAAGISSSQLSRLELAQVPAAAVRTYSVLFSLLGHTLRWNVYPDASPIRDAGHARLIRRFAEQVPRSVRIRTEVGLRSHGDLRAWDGELRFLDGRCVMEAEMVLSDVQALDRRIGLKMRDDDVATTILLVADTRRNRDVLRLHRDLLRPRFPLDTRAVMALVRAGKCPMQGGIVVLSGARSRSTDDPSASALREGTTTDRS